MLNFPDMLNIDHPIFLEIVQRSLEKLLPALGGYERHSYTLNSNYHMKLLDGHADCYLARHGSREIEVVANGLAETEYRPTIGFTLRSKDESRVFRRIIEKSEISENGLFISNYIFVSLPTLTTFDEEKDWIDRTAAQADTVAGISYQEDNADDYADV